MNDTYTIFANKHPNPNDNIQYEITILNIGHTQAETADDVELMARDYLDIFGHDGNAPLKITWLPGGTQTNHPRQHPVPDDM